MTTATDKGSVTELLQPGPGQALSELLDVPMPSVELGLPLLWHWIYLLDRPATADLGSDGHPVRNAVVAPPGPGQRRMWAGGRVQSLAPLLIGQPATRDSEIAATTVKNGKSGELTFVTVRHTIRQDGSVTVIEDQELVYRQSDTSAAGPPPRSTPTPTTSPVDPPAGWQIEVTPPLLFRFSALTYNAHRIHYDRDYARDVEGYPGLLVHGPLQALVMAEAARAQGLPTIGVEFSYRLISPLFDQDGMFVSTGPPSDEATPARQEPDALITTTVQDRTGRPTARGLLAPITDAST